MKKLIFLSFFAFALFSCSSDNEDFSAKSDITTTSGIAEKSAIAATACFKGLEAYYTIDSSHGLNNPIVNYTSVPPAGISAISGFRVSVQVQALLDCEDLDSGTGTITSYTNSTIYYSVNSFPPVISLSPTGFPPCYRWRMVFEGTSKTGCISYSPWYDCPVL